MTRRHDDGFATIWVLSAIAIVIVVAAIAGMVGSVAVRRHRAAAAADAAALAGALVTIDGPSAACSRAAALAAANGATLLECTVDGTVVTVRVAVALPGRLAGIGRATARARAGPATTEIGH